MTRPTHYGRPGTDVIPDDWESRLAPVAAQVQTGTCTVRGPSTPGVADEGSGVRSTTLGAVRYTGACRVQRRDQLHQGDDVAEQVVRTATYLVQIGYSASTVQPGDIVTVTASNDPRLLSGWLTVAEVVEGTLRWERDLWCTRNS